MKHRYACVCPKGCVPAVIQELSDLKLTAAPGGLDWASVDLSDEERAKVLTRCQSIVQLIQVLGTGSSEHILKLAGEIPSPSGTFAVRASGEERLELQESVGAAIKDHTGAPVNLKNPDTLYFLHDSDGEYVFGIVHGGALGKRHYKIITGAQSLTGPFAYGVLRLAGWTPKKDLVVWPSATGELAIEAALAATGKSPRAYEQKVFDSHEAKCRIVCADPKLSMVRSAEKNAKVAGVHSAIRFSRQDADWLDTKYEENEVALLVGILPNLKIMPKLVKEVFYQLEYILKQKGNAHFLCVNEDSAHLLEQAATDYEVKRTYIWSGKHCFTLVSLARKAKSSRNPA